jgi:alpha-beta hydrolase superfamily lysophospholipase
MKTRPFDFANAAGIRLSGRLDLPAGPPHAWALLAHCFTCGKDNLAAVRIARRLAGAGIAVLRFDFTGLGQSEGDFAATNFSLNVADLIAAAAAMTAVDMPPTLLIGHSLGGAAVLAAAGSLPGILAVATIAAPFDVAHVLHQISPEALAEVEQNGTAGVRLGGRPFILGKQFVADIRQHNQHARIAALKRPLLVLHAPHDKVVSIDNATQIFLAAHHPKSFVSLDGADHLLLSPRDADFASDIVAAWSSRYLPEPITAAPSGFDAEAE